MRGGARRLNYMLWQPSPLRNHLHCQGARSWHRRPWQLFSSPGQQKETNTCASLWMSPRASGVGAITGQCRSTLVRHWATVLLRGSTKSRSWDYSIATESGSRGSIEIVKWNTSTIGAAKHHIYCFFQVEEEVILESGTWCICRVPDLLASRAAVPGSNPADPTWVCQRTSTVSQCDQAITLTTASSNIKHWGNVWTYCHWLWHNT